MIRLPISLNQMIRSDGEHSSVGNGIPAYRAEIASSSSTLLDLMPPTLIGWWRSEREGALWKRLGRGFTARHCSNCDGSNIELQQPFTQSAAGPNHNDGDDIYSVQSV